MKNKECYKILTYLASSARGCVNEPKMYGPLRLIDTVVHLSDFFKENNLVDQQDAFLLEELKERIEKDKYTCMDDEETFVQMLDDVIDRLVEE